MRCAPGSGDKRRAVSAPGDLAKAEPPPLGAVDGVGGAAFLQLWSGEQREQQVGPWQLLVSLTLSS